MELSNSYFFQFFLIYNNILINIYIFDLYENDNILILYIINYIQNIQNDYIINYSVIALIPLVVLTIAEILNSLLCSLS